MTITTIGNPNQNQQVILLDPQTQSFIFTVTDGIHETNTTSHNQCLVICIAALFVALIVSFLFFMFFFF